MIKKTISTVLLLILLVGCGTRGASDDGRLQSVYDHVTAAFDQRYDSWTAVDKDRLRETYGIEEDMVAEIIAMEGPEKPEIFIGIRCQDGKSDAALDALKTAAKQLADRPYDTDRAEAVAQKIYVDQYDSYVFLISMGWPEEGLTGVDLAMAAEENQDKIRSAVAEAMSDLDKSDGTSEELDEAAGDAHGNYGGTGQSSEN